MLPDSKASDGVGFFIHKEGEGGEGVSSVERCLGEMKEGGGGRGRGVVSGEREGNLEGGGSWGDAGSDGSDGEGLASSWSPPSGL